MEFKNYMASTKGKKNIYETLCESPKGWNLRIEVGQYSNWS